jgi:hypothetical protein
VASKVLLPRDFCRRIFLLVREPCSASHGVSLACPDIQTQATTAAHLRDHYETLFFPVAPYRRSSGWAYSQVILKAEVTLPNRYRGVAVPLRSAYRT